MYKPQTLYLAAVIGATFDPTLTLYTDAQQQSPLDLTNIDVTMDIGNGTFVLTGGDGLTLGGDEGTIAILLTSAQTATVGAGSLPFSIQFIDTTQPDGEGISYPFGAKSAISFELPNE